MTWLVLLMSCGSPCIERDGMCDPLYEPTFENVYENTLRPTCGFEGTACHGVEGAQAGLVFADIDEAYDLLTDDGDGEPLVLANDAACSVLIQRVDADDETQVMPPGDPLSEEERCAIRMWIDDGAKR